MPKILVIDDDFEYTEYLEGLLKAEGYKIVVMNEAINYLEQIRDYDPDIILLDMQIGLVNGNDVITKIRSQEDIKHKNIVVLTHLDKDYLDFLDLKHKVFDIVLKPYKLDELEKVLKCASVS